MEEWNPILTLQMIVLTLEIMVVEDHPMNKGEILSRLPETGILLQNTRPNISEGSAGAVKPSKKRKREEISNSNGEDYGSDKDSSQYPWKRLKKNLDDLAISSPLTTHDSTVHFDQTE